MRRDVKTVAEDLAKVHAGAKQGFSMIKEELDEHRESINANSDEMDMLAGQMASLEAKLDKISERLDELYMTKSGNPYADLRVKLNVREQEIFLVLYTARKQLRAAEMAKTLGLTVEMVQETIVKLIAKGIPVLRTRNVYTLEKLFKDIQAKKQIIKIDENIKRELAMMVEE